MRSSIYLQRFETFLEHSYILVFVQGRREPMQSQLIQINRHLQHTTLNTDQNQWAIKVTADN